MNKKLNMNILLLFINIINNIIKLEIMSLKVFGNISPGCCPPTT